MNKLSKALILCFLELLLAGFKSQAADFTTDYDVTYEILESHETKVTQKLTVTNLSQKIFASSYSQKINALKPYDIEASDSKGKIETEVIQEEDSTIIKLHFNDKVVGDGNKFNWLLNYKTKDVAFKNGMITDILIPRIGTVSNVNSYNLTLKVPKTMGENSYITPTPEKVSQDEKYNLYQFALDDVTKSSVSASFGAFQKLNFKLSYYIENPNFFETYKEIALPPDIIKKQEISYSQLEPKPLSIKIDEDGNYLAKYKLRGYANLNVTLIGSAKIYNSQIKIEDGGQLDKVPEVLKKNYTRPQKYWESDSEEILKPAKGLNNPKDSVIQNAERAYNFVTGALKYKKEKQEDTSVVRLGAKEALKNPDNSICMEFVDLFIALTRAMGIPSRELNGYAISKNNLTPLSINLRGGDILHSWAEFYDPNLGWIQVDPTWGSTSATDYFTKLDNNHFVFAIKGLSSEYPLPAGFYKHSESSSHQIDISFSQSQEKKDGEYSISATSLNTLNPFSKTILIGNDGPFTIFNINDQKINVPPFGTAKLKNNTKNSKVTLTFYNFLHERRTQAITITNDPENILRKFTKLGPILLLGLALYGIFYFSIAHPKYLKKLIRLLYHRPRDQGQ